VINNHILKPATQVIVILGTTVVVCRLAGRQEPLAVFDDTPGILGHEIRIDVLGQVAQRDDLVAVLGQVAQVTLELRLARGHPVVGGVGYAVEL
jgi:hypothetical protein